MTDWTTPEDVPATTVEHLHRWLNEGNPEDAATRAERAVADVIHAFWPAPEPTLAEELRDTARWWTDGAPTWKQCCERFDALAYRAEQIEKDLADARAAAKTWQEQNENDCEMYSEDIADTLVTLAETRAEVERWKKAEREASVERDDAEAEVEQLRAARERLNAEVERLTAEQAYWKEYALERQRVVERLVAGESAATVAQEENVAPDQQSNSLKTPNSSFKSSLKEPAQNPADVPPGEAWTVEVRGVQTVAVRPDGKGLRQWVMAEFINGTCWCSDSNITLIRRLVPAPRVITDPDELEQLAATSIIRDGRGWPGGITDQGVTMINGFCLSDEEVLAHGPVTVLWEAGE